MNQYNFIMFSLSVIIIIISMENKCANEVYYTYISYYTLKA